MHVIVQDAPSARPPPGKGAADSAAQPGTQPGKPQQQSHMDKEWRFTCYGFAEWTSNGPAGGAPMPRCRVGFRKPSEMSQPGPNREHEAAPPRPDRRHNPLTEQQAGQSRRPEATAPETIQVAQPSGAGAGLDWERAQQRLAAVGDRWAHAGTTLYAATGKSATKLRNRDWSRDASKLQTAMSRTASRTATAATDAADAIRTRLVGSQKPD